MPAATWATKVQVPTPTKETVEEATWQTAGVDEDTLLDPSPLVDTTGTKVAPNLGLGGALMMLGVVGDAWPTVKLCAAPSAADKLEVAATCATSVQDPTATKCTCPAVTVHVAVVLDVTDLVPLLDVEIEGVKLPP